MTALLSVRDLAVDLPLGRWFGGGGGEPDHGVVVGFAEGVGFGVSGRWAWWGWPWPT